MARYRYRAKPGVARLPRILRKHAIRRIFACHAICYIVHIRALRASNAILLLWSFIRGQYLAAVAMAVIPAFQSPMAANRVPYPGKCNRRVSRRLRFWRSERIRIARRSTHGFARISLYVVSNFCCIRHTTLCMLI